MGVVWMDDTWDGGEDAAPAMVNTRFCLSVTRFLVPGDDPNSPARRPGAITSEDSADEMLPPRDRELLLLLRLRERWCRERWRCGEPRLGMGAGYVPPNDVPAGIIIPMGG